MIKKLTKKEVSTLTHFMNLVSDWNDYSRGYSDVVADNLWRKNGITVDVLSRGKTGNAAILCSRKGRIIAIGDINFNGKGIKKCAPCPKRDEKFLEEELGILIDTFGSDVSEYTKGTYAAHKCEIISRNYQVLEIRDQKLILIYKNNKVVLVGDAETKSINKCA